MRVCEREGKRETPTQQIFPTRLPVLPCDAGRGDVACGRAGVSGAASRALKEQGAGSEPFSWPPLARFLWRQTREAPRASGWRQQWPLGAGPTPRLALGDRGHGEKGTQHQELIVAKYHETSVTKQESEAQGGQ